MAIKKPPRPANCLNLKQGFSKKKQGFSLGLNPKDRMITKPRSNQSSKPRVFVDLNPTIPSSKVLISPPNPKKMSSSTKPIKNLLKDNKIFGGLDAYLNSSLERQKKVSLTPTLSTEKEKIEGPNFLRKPKSIRVLFNGVPISSLIMEKIAAPKKEIRPVDSVPAKQSKKTLNFQPSENNKPNYSSASSRVLNDKKSILQRDTARIGIKPMVSKLTSSRDEEKRVRKNKPSTSGLKADTIPPTIRNDESFKAPDRVAEILRCYEDTILKYTCPKTVARKKEEERERLRNKQQEEERERLRNKQLLEEKQRRREAARIAVDKVVKTIEFNEGDYVEQLEELSQFYPSGYALGYQGDFHKPLERLGLYLKPDDYDKADDDDVAIMMQGVRKRIRSCSASLRACSFPYMKPLVI